MRAGGWRPAAEGPRRGSVPAPSGAPETKTYKRLAQQAEPRSRNISAPLGLRSDVVTRPYRRHKPPALRHFTSLSVNSGVSTQFL